MRYKASQLHFLRFGIISKVDVLYFPDLDKSPSTSMSIRPPPEPQKFGSLVEEAPHEIGDAPSRMSGMPPARPTSSIAAGQDVPLSSPPSEFLLPMFVPKAKLDDSSQNSRAQ
jgi:hypothetical protein